MPSAKDAPSDVRHRIGGDRDRRPAAGIGLGRARSHQGGAARAARSPRNRRQSRPSRQPWDGGPARARRHDPSRCAFRYRCAPFARGRRPTLIRCSVTPTTAMSRCTCAIAFRFRTRWSRRARSSDWIAKQPSPTVWAIEVDGEAVGGIGIELHTDVERVSAEIGYWLGEAMLGTRHRDRGVDRPSRLRPSSDSISRVSMRYPLPITPPRCACSKRPATCAKATSARARSRTARSATNCCLQPIDPYEKATSHSCVRSD